MARQSIAIIDTLRARDGFPLFEAVQVALLPSQLLMEMEPDDDLPRSKAKLISEIRASQAGAPSMDTVSVLTWQELLEGFGDADDPGGWLAVLAEALDRYEELRSPRPSQSGMTGLQIHAALARGEFGDLCIGREGGLAAFRRDLADDPSWHRRRYKVAEPAAVTTRERALKYFSGTAFLEALEEHGRPTPTTAKRRVR